MKEEDGFANPVDEEYYRRTSNFLAVNRLKTNVPGRSSRGVMEHRSAPVLIRLSRIRFKLKIEPGI